MGNKRADLWYYGNIGDKEYNSGQKNYLLEPTNNCSSEKIVIMGYQIGAGTAIRMGEKPNEYVEDLGELQIIYRYLNDGNDLEIDWKWKKVEVKANGGDPGVPKPVEPSSGGEKSNTYTYLDKDGKQVTKEWKISEENFLDYLELSYEQIKSICNSKNKELVEKGFDVAIYNCSQQLKINSKVILATLAQEQGWCKNGKYDKAFGVGPGGNPKTFSDFEKGGLFKSVNTYIKWFNVGKKNRGKELHVNLDLKPYDETNAVFKSKTKTWQDSNKKYVEYMEKGIKIIPTNAVMYAKLKYTPWIDFPPQNSKPLEQWHDIYINLK